MPLLTPDRLCVPCSLGRIGISKVIRGWVSIQFSKDQYLLEQKQKGFYVERLEYFLERTLWMFCNFLSEIFLVALSR